MPHFGPFLSEEKKNWKKRNFFSATVQGLSVPVECIDPFVKLWERIPELQFLRTNKQPQNVTLCHLPRTVHASRWILLTLRWKMTRSVSSLLLPEMDSKRMAGCGSPCVKQQNVFKSVNQTYCTIEWKEDKTGSSHAWEDSQLWRGKYFGQMDQGDGM